VRKYIVKIEVSVTDEQIREIWEWEDGWEDSEVERALKEELYEIIRSPHAWDEMEFVIEEEEI